MNLKSSVSGAVLMALLGVSTDAAAQMKSDGKWHFPDNIRSMCINHEQSIVATYKALVENNNMWMDPNNTGDKSKYPQLTDALKRSIADSEVSWDRLGCVYIIYGVKK